LRSTLPHSMCEKDPFYSALLKHTQQRGNSNSLPLKTNTHNQEINSTTELEGAEIM